MANPSCLRDMKPDALAVAECKTSPQMQVLNSMDALARPCRLYNAGANVGRNLRQSEGRATTLTGNRGDGWRTHAVPRLDPPTHTSTCSFFSYGHEFRHRGNVSRCARTFKSPVDCGP